MIRLFYFFLAIFCVIFIVFPIMHLFISLTVNEFIKAIYDREVWQAIFTSFIGASLSTFFGCLTGIPFAYILSRYDFKGKKILESIASLPVVIPHVAVGIILISLLSEKSFWGHFFSYFNLSFIDTIYGIVIAMAFVSISYIITSALIGFESVDRELEMVSRTLGATAFYTFWHITFPLALPAIIKGAILAFARAISEVGALLILAYFPKTAPIIMYERFEQYGLKAAHPVTVLVVFFSLIIFFVLLYFSKRHAFR
ncbi:MAG: ABC transporter permease [Candidatus Desulfofervidus auxilii]|nr:ABC transporter permease [Candidatus Desulfofervidus auxilii]